MDDLTDAPTEGGGAEAAETEAIEPVEVDDAEGTEGTEAQSAEQQATYKLSDGTEVPLSELEKGYLRQSDYTKKTQEVARQREEAAQALALFEALQSDPQNTLDALTKHLATEAPDESQTLTPEQRELAEVKEFIERQQEQEFLNWLNTETASIASEFGGEIDPFELAEFAADNQIPNLRAAYLFREDQAQHETKRAAENQRVLEAKRGAPSIAGGSKATGTTAGQQAPPKTVAEAYALALEELG